MTVAEMTPKLLSVVSDRTGYPSEMLTMDMELESDLGIDSIKRVEILSAMQDLVPELPEVDLAVMASLSTLGEIVDYLTAQAAGSQASGDQASSSHPDAVETEGARRTEDSPADEQAPFGRFVLSEATQVAPGTPLPGLFDASIAIIADPDGIGSALATALTEAGATAELIDSVDSNEFRSVIYLGNLCAVDDPDHAAALNRDAFEVARAFATHASPGGAFVAVDSQGGIDPDRASDPTRAWAGGLAALMSTATIEWPETSTKMIDIELGGREPQLIAEQIAAELIRGGADREIALDASGRRVSVTTEAVQVAHGACPLGADDVVVISGGGRGVTAATTVELARSCGATFVLLGRSALVDEIEHHVAALDDAALKQTVLADAKAADEDLTPAELSRRVGAIVANREVRATLDSIERAGGRAHYLAVDITDRSAVISALDSVRTEIGPITGLVHGAGVLADKLIAEKTNEQFDTVFDTKVRGLHNLLDATADDQLAVLCLFSSIAARTGNVGQSDYAMANEVLNRVAVHEHRRRGGSCIVKSLGWGPWAGGMVTPTLEAHFTAMGVALIDLEVGARMLVEELSSPQTDDVEVLLGGGVLAAPSASAPRVDA